MTGSPVDRFAPVVMAVIAMAPVAMAPVAVAAPIATGADPGGAFDADAGSVGS